MTQVENTASRLA